MGFDFSYTEEHRLIQDSIHKALKQLEPKHQAF